MRILVLLGTRPEVIKLAPVIKAARRTDGIEPIVCFTGQHREMAESVFQFFDVKPDIELDVMRPGQTLETLTSTLLVKIGAAIETSEPELVLVQGDTTSAMAGALAALYRNVPLGHVEAGLRTGNMRHPWPEEANRRLISVVADRHYTPTGRATKNLLREGIAPGSIVETGNTVVDALLFARERLSAMPQIRAGLEAKFGFLQGAGRIILATVHRRESHGPGIEAVCRALKEIATIPDTVVVFPMHLNPNVREPVGRSLGGIANIHLLEPLDYGEFVFMMSRSHLILTDSGGVQEEAPTFGKPVLIMRETSEREEAVDAGVARLVGTDFERIVAEARALLTNSSAYADMAHPANPFGDGTAANRIIKDIVDYHAAFS